jgi:hypothetical protein
MLLLLACVTPDSTPPPDFDEAVHLAFRNFESASDAEMGDLLLIMEREIDASLDLAGDVNARALLPTRIAGLEVPDRDPALAVTSAVARLSAFGLAAHVPLALFVDQTPLEPQCPNFYERAFTEGEDCWPDCILRTENDLTKESGIFIADYVLPKVYRPIPMADGRVASVTRTWTRDTVVAREDAARIEQSESFEFFLERADGSGTLRMMAVWSETTFPDLEIEQWVVEGTIRAGTDAIFARQDAWLTENP